MYRTIGKADIFGYYIFMYKSSINYERTKAEIESELLSWQRDDVAFFAAGACHILAYTFREKYPDLGYQIIYIRPKSPFSSWNHVYIISGEYAFDFWWWNTEEEILSIFSWDYRNKYPWWDYDRIILDIPLEQFCDENNHRKPQDFYGDVISRAQKYIQQII